MTSPSDPFFDRAAEPQREPASRGDAWSRALMGAIGSILVLFPLVTTSGLSAVASTFEIGCGVVLIVLCAFQPRIGGVLRFRDFGVPIRPPQETTKPDLPTADLPRELPP